MSESLGTFLGAAGACPEVTANGRTWRFGHPTQRAKSELEKIVVQKATDAVLELKPVLPPASFKALFDGLMAEIRRGDFKTWGAGWQSYVFDPQYAHLFVLSLLRECHPDAAEADVVELVAAEPERVQVALAQVVPDFFALALAGVRLTPDQRAAADQAVEAIRATLRATLRPPTPATGSPTSSTS